ncbi:MAG: hypothetical protein AB1728_05935 [Bacteroidota bacterium]
MSDLLDVLDKEIVSNGGPALVHAAVESAVDETLYLTGRPTLRQFLRFAKHEAVHPQPEELLAQQWQSSADILRMLEKEEAGFADNAPITKMDIKAYEPLLIEFLKDPLVQNGFNTVPTEVAFIELDRLVVYQHHIDLTYSKLLVNEFGGLPSDEKIFRTALMHDHPQAPVKYSRVHRNQYVFLSPSNDLRFLGTMKLQPENIKEYPPPGNLAGVIGIAVGFGSNFLNAIYTGKRLILNNGYHRAYTLRKAGVTHAPCIIQHALSKDEFEVVAASDVVDNLDYYLNNPRPSLLKDYFDPRLHVVMQTHRRIKQVVVKFEVDDGYLPAF